MFNRGTRTRKPSSCVRTGATRSHRKSERYLELKVRLWSTRRVLTSLTPHPDSLSDRLGADEAVPRQVFEREPGCHQASAATLPDYVGEGFAVLIYYGPRLVLKSAQPSDDCSHRGLDLKACGSSLAGIFIRGLPGSARSKLVTHPFASTKLTNTETGPSTAGARASSRSNRRERFLVVIFVSVRHGGAYGNRCAITPL
jgi:hypothetical protein